MPHGSNCSPVLAVAIVALAGPWSAGGCQPAKKQASSGSGGSSANATGGKVSGGGAGGSSAIGSGGNLAGGSGGNGPGGGNGTGRGGAGGNGSGGGAGAGATGGSGGNGSGGSAGAGGSGAGGSASGGRAGASGSGSGGKGGAGSISAGGIGGMRNGGAGGTAGGSGGQTATDPGSAPTAITGLKIDANPNNVLSAFASWTTDTPADSVVQFGEGEYEWEISDPALVTSHKVLIIGMHASKAYQIKAISSAGGASVNATGNFTAGSLPAQIPVGNVAINDTTKAQAGWTLMNVQKGDGNSIPSSNYPAMAVMYDSGGQPVWYYIDGTTNDYGGAIFYAIHTVELVQELLGPGWRKVSSKPGKNPLIRFRSGEHTATLEFRPLDASGSSSFGVEVTAPGVHIVQPIPLADDYMAPVVDQIAAMLRAGTSPMSRDELLAPIALMEEVDALLKADA